MPRHPLARGLLCFLSFLGVLAAMAMSPAAAGGRTLDQETMADAVRYLGVLAGRELSAEDAAWLKERWSEEAKTAPGSVAGELDGLAFSYERYQRDKDPIRLAEARASIAKTAYCAAEQSSDAAAHRLRNILASDELVLAADCVLGLVVTRFDVDGLVASHALTAAATGQGHDAADDRAATVSAITEGFSDAAPGEKRSLANGELGHAVLGRFWRLIDGSAEQAAVIREIGSAASVDVRGPARQLEALAQSKLGGLDHLAQVGDARLTAGAMTTYFEWLERIAGYRFDSRDRDWLQQVVIQDFKEDPKKVLDEVANIKVMNRDFVLLDREDEKRRRVAAWAGSLHCYLDTSGDPDERQLAKVVFREDPVIETDCGTGAVRRQSHTVLAEANGQELQEQNLDIGMRFSAMILGRPLLPEEIAVVRKDMIENFERDPAVWYEEVAQYRALLANIEKYDTSVFLGMDERKKLVDPIYCALKTSDEPYADDYVAMFERDGAILFDDCGQQLVTTENEIQAVVAVANFLALLNDKPPLEAAQIQEIRDAFKSKYLGKAESSMLALQEWWSLLSLEEKAAEAQKAKADGITIEADAKTIAGYVESAKLQVVLRNAKIKSCRLSAIIVQGQTAIFAAKHGPYTASANNPLGISGLELGSLITTTNALGEICKGVLGG